MTRQPETTRKVKRENDRDQGPLNLRLTSPLMRGKDVERAQRALNNSKFGDFYDGEITGKYDEHTANAARRAWWFLGFPKATVSRHYTDRLHAYLTGQRKLTNAMSKTREQRKKQAAKEHKEGKGGVFLKAIQIGLKEQGVHESPPGSNRVKYSVWYGVIGSWCAMFDSWCMAKAGSRVFDDDHFAYVPNVLAAAHNGVGDMRVVNLEHARHCKTDLALWRFPPSDHYPNHVSFKLDINGSTVRSLDGNTNSNGEVAIRTRPASLVMAWVHVEE